MLYFNQEWIKDKEEKGQQQKKGGWCGSGKEGRKSLADIREKEKITTGWLYDYDCQ